MSSEDECLLLFAVVVRVSDTGSLVSVPRYVPPPQPPRSGAQYEASVLLFNLDLSERSQLKPGGYKTHHTN